MQDPFQTFLGADATDAQPLPPSAMSPGSDGAPASAASPQSPHDAQPVQATAPLAVPAGTAAPAVVVEAPEGSHLKKILGIGAVVVLGYWLLKAKPHSTRTNPRRRRHSRRR